MSALTAPAELADRVFVQRLFSSGRARRIRLSLGLSRTAMAKAVGVNESSYADWEAGATLRAGNALRYATVLAGLIEELTEPEWTAILKEEDGA